MSSTNPRWAVMAWEEIDGNVYVVEVLPPCFCQIRTEFNRPDGEQLSDIITSRTMPVMNWTVQGDTREARKFPRTSFQQAIDTVQRMVRDHR